VHKYITRKHQRINKHQYFGVKSGSGSETTPAADL